LISAAGVSTGPVALPDVSVVRQLKGRCVEFESHARAAQRLRQVNHSVTVIFLMALSLPLMRMRTQAEIQKENHKWERKS
jgi:hypothetical protein